MYTRQDCLIRDKADTLAALRDDFDIPQNTIYLDGNSLGAMPKAALARAQAVITQEWGRDLITSWNTADWWNLPTRMGDMIAPLIGAGAGEVVVTDTTSMNLFKVVANAVRIQQEDRPERKLIIAERDAFPTDLYMIQGFMDMLDRGYSLQLIDTPEDLDGMLADAAVVVLSHVNYRTGYLFDMTRVTQKVHAAGALIVWDLCHSIGAVPMNVNQADADFAIGCTYKYLNGGPGAPAMLWANPRHAARYWQPLSGWWSHAQPFAMKPDYAGASGVRRYLAGTQPILSMSLVAVGLETYHKTDMQALRKKSLALTDLFIALVEQECPNHPLELVTPRQHSIRGSHVSFAHPHGYEVIQALIARGVIGDYREPQVMRFGVTPLYLRHVDIWDAVAHLKQILDTEEWNKEQYRQRGDVT